jgi:putative acetyltransferase
VWVFLRRELPDDSAAIFALHDAAFARPGVAVTAEAALVGRLRSDGDILPGLSIVVETSQNVVGHVVCSRASIDGQTCIGLGPLGVHPAHQRRGFGHALMHAVLAAADALDAPAVALLGDPRYYARFGFEPAESLGVSPPQPEWGAHFQVRRLTAWSPSLSGRFRYAAAFDPL